VFREEGKPIPPDRIAPQVGEPFGGGPGP
jgi:hypothetical protein